MPVFTGTLRSGTVLTELPLTMVLPQNTGPIRRVLYLLHDLGQGHTSWLYRCRLEQISRQWSTAIVLPELWRSLYCDMAYGRKWFTYLSEELPEQMHKTLALELSGPQDCCVAGVGLGGYGALRCMLTHPESFGRAAAIEAPLLLEEALLDLLHSGELTGGELTGQYGLSAQLGPQDRLLSLAESLPSGKASGLRFYQYSGTARWREQNRQAAEKLTRILPCRYEEEEVTLTDWETVLRRSLTYVWGEGREKI